MRLKDLMTTPVVTVTPETHLKEVAALLVAHEISGVPVVNEDEELVGIVSEADLVTLETGDDPRSHIISRGWRRFDRPRTVREVMVEDVVTLPESADVAEAARLMLERGVKRIPVVGGDRVIGIVTRRDVLKVFARTDSEILAELEDLLDDEILMMGHFRAEVSDGIVTLFGAEEKAGRRLAELLARSVPGVIAVRFEEPLAG